MQTTHNDNNKNHPSPPSEVDVLIVGAGGSGLAAAVSALEQGARVLALEKRPEPGGTTGIAIGSFTASQTALQRKKGIEDSPEDHEIDAGRFPPPELEARNNTALRARFLRHAAETFDWLRAMGLQFHGPFPEPPNRVPRMHNVIPNARSYIDAMRRRMLRMGGILQTSAAVTGLLFDNGRVVGVEYEHNDAKHQCRASRGVILAAGDYANSPEWIGRFKGPSFRRIEGINPHATGDGHALAESAGARLVNMDVTYGPELRFVPPASSGGWLPAALSHPWMAKLAGTLLPWIPRRFVYHYIKTLLVTWQHPENSLFDDGAILVNKRGERFCDETQTPAREIAVAEQPGKTAYLLLDRSLIERYSQWPNFISTAPRIAYAYVKDYLRMRPDIAREAESLKALASGLDCAPERLVQTVRAHNQSSTKPLEGNRWTLLGPLKAYFTTTEGGAALGEHFEVLNEKGEPIPGLYAAGQNGLGGQVLWGHGLHIAWALTSGRLAGAWVAGLENGG